MRIKNRLKRDVDFFRNKISKIEGSGDIGDYLSDIVDAKTVASEAAERQEGKEARDSESTASSSETPRQAEAG